MEFPQGWNCYAYVHNSPLNNTDPDGLECIHTSDQTSSSVKVTVEGGTCSKDNGTYVNGTVDVKSLTYNGSELGYSFSNAEEQTGGSFEPLLQLQPADGQQRERSEA